MVLMMWCVILRRVRSRPLVPSSLVERYVSRNIPAGAIGAVRALKHRSACWEIYTVCTSPNWIIPALGGSPCPRSSCSRWWRSPEARRCGGRRRRRHPRPWRPSRQRTFSRRDPQTSIQVNLSHRRPDIQQSHDPETRIQFLLCIVT